MSYTPEQLREQARSELYVRHEREQFRAHADALDTIAKLKAHAEALAERLDAWARIDECKCSEVDAYRRDFPKEEK